MYFPLIILIIFLVPAVLIPVRINKNYLPEKVLAESIISTCMLVVLVLAIAKAETGMALGDQLMEVFKIAAGALADQTEFVNAAGLGSLSHSERVPAITSMYGTLNSMMPCAVVIASALVSYVTYFTISAIRSKRRKTTVLLTPIRFFRWPQSFMAGFFVMFILSLALEYTKTFSDTALFLNVSILMEFAIAVQGLAAMAFLFDLKRIPKIVTLVAGIFGMVTGPGRMVLFGLGAADYIFNLRFIWTERAKFKRRK